MPDHAANVLTGQRRQTGTPFPLAPHKALIERVLVGPVHRMEILMEGDEARSHFQGREVAGQQNHPLAARYGRLQVFQPFDPTQWTHFFVRSPPGRGQFEKSRAQRGEMPFRQIVALRLGQFRETQRQVDVHHMAAIAVDEAE